MEFEELKMEYNSINEGCCRCGKIYDYRKNRNNPLFCLNWSCDRCRGVLKNRLYHSVIQNIYMFNLNKHFVITSEGKEYRNKYSFEESFSFMSSQWKKFKKCIEYNYYERYTKKGYYAPYIGETFHYILFPRAQRDGYCHFHLIIPDEISWDFLDNIRKKYGLGYVSIQKNQSVAEYLHRDFFKDHEYIIPHNVKHYISSRALMLNNYSKPDKSKFFGEIDCVPEKILFKTNKKEVIYNTLCDVYGRALPFEEYVKEYMDLVR